MLPRATAVNPYPSEKSCNKLIRKQIMTTETPWWIRLAVAPIILAIIGHATSFR